LPLFVLRPLTFFGQADDSLIHLIELLGAHALSQSDQ
jgi:hypothetical protein